MEALALFMLAIVVVLVVGNWIQKRRCHKDCITEYLDEHCIGYNRAASYHMQEGVSLEDVATRHLRVNSKYPTSYWIAKGVEAYLNDNGYFDAEQDK